MGMSIDEAMINLHAIQDYYNNDMLDSYVGFDRKDNESVDVAIDTMRKYQKIEQLIAMDDENHRRTIKLCELRKVMEDGNNNTDGKKLC